MRDLGHREEAWPNPAVASPCQMGHAQKGKVDALIERNCARALSGRSSVSRGRRRRRRRRRPRRGQVVHLQGLQGRRDQGGRRQSQRARPRSTRVRGNWAAIKKALLATFKGEAGAEKQFDAYLSGASAKVKAAAAVVLKLDGSFKTVIQSSTSLTAVRDRHHRGRVDARRSRRR